MARTGNETQKEKLVNIRRNTNRRPTRAGSSRDIGLSGSGKGDAPRNCFSTEFRRNFEKIFHDTRRAVHQDPTFTRTGATRYTKKF